MRGAPLPHAGRLWLSARARQLPAPRLLRSPAPLRRHAPARQLLPLRLPRGSPEPPRANAASAAARSWAACIACSSANARARPSDSASRSVSTRRAMSCAASASACARSRAARSALRSASASASACCTASAAARACRSASAFNSRSAFASAGGFCGARVRFSARARDALGVTLGLGARCRFACRLGLGAAALERSRFGSAARLQSAIGRALVLRLQRARHARPVAWIRARRLRELLRSWPLGHPLRRGRLPSSRPRGPLPRARAPDAAARFRPVRRRARRRALRCSAAASCERCGIGKLLGLEPEVERARALRLPRGRRFFRLHLRFGFGRFAPTCQLDRASVGFRSRLRGRFGDTIRIEGRKLPLAC